MQEIHDFCSPIIHPRTVMIHSWHTAITYSTMMRTRRLVTSAGSFIEQNDVLYETISLYLQIMMLVNCLLPTCTSHGPRAFYLPSPLALHIEESHQDLLTRDSTVWWVLNQTLMSPLWSYVNWPVNIVLAWQAKAMAHIVQYIFARVCDNRPYVASSEIVIPEYAVRQRL